MEEYLLTCLDVARILQVSRSQVYYLIQVGDLRTVRIRTSLRIRPVDLEDYIYIKSLDYGKESQAFLNRERRYIRRPKFL